MEAQAEGSVGRARKRNTVVKEAAKRALSSLPQIPIHVSEILKLVLKERQQTCEQLASESETDSVVDESHLLRVLSESCSGRAPTFYRAVGHNNVFGLASELPANAIVVSSGNGDNDNEELLVQLPEQHPIIEEQQMNEERPYEAMEESEVTPEPGAKEREVLRDDETNSEHELKEEEGLTSNVLTDVSHEDPSIAIDETEETTEVVLHQQAPDDRVEKDETSSTAQDQRNASEKHSEAKPSVDSTGDNVCAELLLKDSENNNAQFSSNAGLKAISTVDNSLVKVPKISEDDPTTTSEKLEEKSERKGFEKKTEGKYTGDEEVSEFSEKVCSPRQEIDHLLKGPEAIKNDTRSLSFEEAVEQAEIIFSDDTSLLKIFETNEQVNDPIKVDVENKIDSNTFNFNQRRRTSPRISPRTLSRQPEGMKSVTTQESPLSNSSNNKSEFVQHDSLLIKSSGVNHGHNLRPKRRSQFLKDDLESMAKKPFHEAGKRRRKEEEETKLKNSSSINTVTSKQSNKNNKNGGSFQRTHHRSRVRENGDIEIAANPAEVKLLNGSPKRLNSTHLTSKILRKQSKKLSASAAIQQVRETSSVDLESPESVVGQVNLRLLLNKGTFMKLSPSYQLQLMQLLPQVDSIYNDDNSSVRLRSSSLNNEFFAKACQEWREQLLKGDFTLEAQQKNKADCEKEKLRLDPWKAKHFEPIWGVKKDYTLSSSSLFLPPHEDLEHEDICSSSSIEVLGLKRKGEDGDASSCEREDANTAKRAHIEGASHVTGSGSNGDSQTHGLHEDSQAHVHLVQQEVIEEAVIEDHLVETESLLTELSTSVRNEQLPIEVRQERPKENVPSLIESSCQGPKSLLDPPSLEPAVGIDDKITSSLKRPLLASIAQDVGKPHAIDENLSENIKLFGEESPPLLVPEDTSDMSLNSNAFAYNKASVVKMGASDETNQRGNVESGLITTKSSNLQLQLPEAKANENKVVAKFAQPSTFTSSPIDRCTKAQRQQYVLVPNASSGVLSTSRVGGEATTMLLPVSSSATTHLVATRSNNGLYVSGESLNSVVRVQQQRPPLILRRMPVVNGQSNLITVTSNGQTRRLVPVSAPNSLRLGNQQGGITLRTMVQPPFTVVRTSSTCNSPNQRFPRVSLPQEPLNISSLDNSNITNSRPPPDLFQKPLPKPSQQQHQQRSQSLSNLSVIQLPNHPIPITSPDIIKRIQKSMNKNIVQRPKSVDIVVNGTQGVINQVTRPSSASCVSPQTVISPIATPPPQHAVPSPSGIPSKTPTKVILVQNASGQLMALQATNQMPIQPTISIVKSNNAPPRASSAPPTNVLNINGNVASKLVGMNSLPTSNLPKANISDNNVQHQEPKVEAGYQQNHHVFPIEVSAISQVTESNRLTLATTPTTTEATNVSHVAPRPNRTGKEMMLKSYGVPLLPKPPSTTSGTSSSGKNEANRAESGTIPCNIKAMIACQKCGAFCHNDCMGPGAQVCVSCLIR